MDEHGDDDLARLTHLARFTGIVTCTISEIVLVFVALIDGMSWGLAAMFIGVVSFHAWLAGRR